MWEGCSLRGNQTQRPNQEKELRAAYLLKASYLSWAINYLSVLALSICFLTLMPSLYLGCFGVKWRSSLSSSSFPSYQRNPLLQSLQGTSLKSTKDICWVCLLRVPLLNGGTDLVIQGEKAYRPSSPPNPKVWSPRTTLSPVLTCKLGTLLLTKVWDHTTLWQGSLPAVLKPYTNIHQ